MAIEQKWPAVTPRLFTADGGQYGVIKVLSAAGFKVNQRVVVSAVSLPSLTLQVKRIMGPDTIIVGPIPTKQGEQSLTARQDLTAYTVALGSHIYAEEQDKAKLKPDDIWQAIYRQEPGTTIGVEIDDQYGNPIDSVRDSNGINRLAVDGQFTAEVDVNVNVDIDALNPATQPTPDNILIVGTENGQQGGLKRPFVNNLKEQILATHDRTAIFTYADFGTKNQRIIQVDYSSATFPANTVRRQFAYTLVGNSYRRDSETWTII